MKNLILLSQFMRMLVDVLITKTGVILTAVTANVALFPLPKPTIATIQGALDELIAAQAEAITGGKVARMIRNQKRIALVNLLKELGVYVSLCANGDRTIAAASEMELVKIRGSVAPISHVSTPRLKMMNEGEIRAKIERVIGAKIYKFRITTDPTLPMHEWQEMEWDKVTYLFTGLNPGTRYYICVAAVGKDGQTVCSGHATIIAP